MALFDGARHLIVLCLVDKKRLEVSHDHGDNTGCHHLDSSYRILDTRHSITYLFLGWYYEFSTGYQVTFSQIGDAYTDDEYEFLVAMFREMSSDGAVYAGKFGGYPEISFHFSNRDLAVKLAKKFNQYSVWNWKIYDNLITGGTGIRG